MACDSTTTFHRSGSLSSREIIHLLLLFLVLPGCAPTPFRLPLPTSPLLIIDDHSLSSLQAAVDRSLHFFEKTPPAGEVLLCGKSYPATRLQDTLRSLAKILAAEPNQEQLSRQLAEGFEICPADDQLLITGYYEPLLDGSIHREPPFIYPLYRVPPNLVQASDAEGNKVIGRRAGNNLLPYWTRGEIEQENLLAGHELVYLADPVQAFTVHIQGSARIRLRDGTVRSVHFAAKNGQPYRSIGRLLIDEGRLRRQEVNMPRIVQYLADHPEEQERILQHNDSYIFFQWQEGPGPNGSLGEPLTGGRSVAADHRFFPAGSLGYLQTAQPLFNKADEVKDWRLLSRLVLVQDSGSAIKGPRRLDFFWGSDDRAAVAAGLMQHPGRFYLLIAKD